MFLGPHEMKMSHYFPPPNFELFPTETRDFFDFSTPPPPFWTNSQVSLLFRLESFPLLFPCTQSHPLQCPKLTKNLVVDKKLELKEKFVYGSVDEQLTYVQIYQEFWKLRQEKLNELREQSV